MIANYCGSSVIDMEFDKFLLSHFGKQRLEKVSDSERYKLHQEFVKRKEEFKDADETPTQYIPLPTTLQGKIKPSQPFSYSRKSKVRDSVSGDESLLAISR